MCKSNKFEIKIVVNVPVYSRRIISNNTAASFNKKSTKQIRREMKQYIDEIKCFSICCRVTYQILSSHWRSLWSYNAFQSMSDFLRCASIHTNICMCALSMHLFTLMLYKGNVIRFRYHRSTTISHELAVFFFIPKLHNGILSLRKECISLVHLFLILYMFFHMCTNRMHFLCLTADSQGNEVIRRKGTIQWQKKNWSNKEITMEHTWLWVRRKSQLFCRKWGESN